MLVFSLYDVTVYENKALQLMSSLDSYHGIVLHSQFITALLLLGHTGAEYTRARAATDGSGSGDDGPVADAVIIVPPEA